MATQTTAAPSRRSPSLAALLSFVWPGLGQVYVGRRREAIVMAVPAILLVLVGLWLARQGFVVLAARFASANLAAEAVIVVLALGLWRIASVAHAYAVAGSFTERRRRPQVTAFALLIAAVVAVHGVAGYYFWSVYEFDKQVFDGNMPGGVPGQSADPNASLPAYYNETIPPNTPPPNSSRVTILLTGVDSAPSRTEHLNDTLLLVSLDKEKKTVALVSIPRDTAGFPMYYGGNAPATMKINSVVTYAAMGVLKSPDSPVVTLMKEVGYLVGVPVNYYATIDLNGFTGLIDKVGGVDVYNPNTIDDSTYDWLDGSPYGFYLSAGNHHLNGRLTLAYVRSRKGYGDNDYTRASRQQDVLVALEKKIASPSNVVNLPNILQAAAPVVRTNFPSEQIADMVAMAQEVPSSAISKYVLGPPYSKLDATPQAGTWTSCLYMDKVAALSVQLFGQDSRYSAQSNVDPQC